MYVIKFKGRFLDNILYVVSNCDAPRHLLYIINIITLLVSMRLFQRDSLFMDIPK